MSTLPTRYRHVQGMGEINALLAGYPIEVRQTVLAAGASEAAKPLRRAQKRYARRSIRTGALHASIKAKTKNYKANATAVSIVGPDRAYYVGRKAIKSGTAKGIGRKQLRDLGAERPALYAHLVEYGHHVVGKGGSKAGGASYVPAKPFVRPAVLAAKSEMVAAFDDGVVRGLTRAHAKIKASARTLY